MGGAINLPAGDAINDLGIDAALVGVDVDAFVAMDAQYQSLWLATVEKALSSLTTQSVQDHAEGVWTPGAYLGNLSNDGVGLSDYHDWSDRVSPELAGRGRSASRRHRESERFKERSRRSATKPQVVSNRTSTEGAAPGAVPSSFCRSATSAVGPWALWRCDVAESVIHARFVVTDAHD